MNRSELCSLICRKKSFLCVGLDPDMAKLPACLNGLDDPVFAFNKQIIDATIDYAVAYKPNLAFYETNGVKGWISLEKTIAYLKSLHAEAFIIADAKRGDIGNTSTQYARAFFEPGGGLEADAVTVAPYMGEDSVRPFLGWEGKWVILLALTSNKGAADFQLLEIQENGNTCRLFEKVLKTSSTWGSADNMMFVVGATQASMLADIRKIIPDHFLLVPGVGSQGGSLAEVAMHGMNKQCGLLVNASRSILYASNGNNFADKAALEAQKLQQEMEVLIKKNKLI